MKVDYVCAQGVVNVPSPICALNVSKRVYNNGYTVTTTAAEVTFYLKWIPIGVAIWVYVSHDASVTGSLRVGVSCASWVGDSQWRCLYMFNNSADAYFDTNYEVHRPSGVLLFRVSAAYKNMIIVRHISTASWSNKTDQTEDLQAKEGIYQFVSAGDGGNIEAIFSYNPDVSGYFGYL